jgi:hypothetical protein
MRIVCFAFQTWERFLSIPNFLKKYFYYRNQTIQFIKLNIFVVSLKEEFCNYLTVLLVFYERTRSAMIGFIFLPKVSVKLYVRIKKPSIRGVMRDIVGPLGLIQISLHSIFTPKTPLIYSIRITFVYNIFPFSSFSSQSVRNSVRKTVRKK